MPEGMSKPYNGNQDFSSLAKSAWDIPYQYLKGSFNNYVDQTAGGGVKKCIFLSTHRA